MQTKNRRIEQEEKGVVDGIIILSERFFSPPYIYQ